MYTLSCTNLIYAQDEKTCKNICCCCGQSTTVLDLIIFCYWFFCGIFLCHLLQTYNNNSVFFESSNKLPSCCNIYSTYIYVHFNPMFIKICFTYIYLQLISYVFFYFQLWIQGKKISLEQVTHITNNIKRVFASGDAVKI